MRAACFVACVLYAAMAHARILLLDKIYFHRGSAALEASQLPVLDDLARGINSQPSLRRLEVQGYADATERATDDAATELGAERAAAVVKYFVERGVDSSRLVARGYGRTRPPCKTRTELCRAKSRRVELIVIEQAPE